ncbi:Hypothetical predicted protein [Paramuricea clavata]|uniref:Uncharacterized protein n=1 Tax=Paramuricea clavata TaxID=317549 RepID=A0A6S7L519_PARCT|nr:Hypothetical predicted protein [Paramuricea clavata]
MSSIRISWIFCFFNCFIFLTSSSVSRPGVRTLLTSRGLNFVRKLAVPVIIKKINNLEILPITGNVDFFFGNLNYKFKK